MAVHFWPKSRKIPNTARVEEVLYFTEYLNFTLGKTNIK
jgi:hypothetical protein